MENEPGKTLPPVVMPSYEDLELLDLADSRSRTARHAQVVAAFQIVGGIAGASLYVLQLGMVFTGLFNALGFLYTLSVLCLTVYAGFLLWTGRSHAADLSVLVQSAQVPFLFSSGFQYDVFSFFRVGIGFSPSRWALKFDLGVSRGLAVFPGEKVQFGLSFLALGIVIWLLLHRNTLNTRLE